MAKRRKQRRNSPATGDRTATLANQVLPGRERDRIATSEELPAGVEVADTEPPTAAVPLHEDSLCPACDSPDFRVLFNAFDRLYRSTDETFRVVECSQCRLIRLYPRPRPTDIYSFYPENYWCAPEACAAERLEEAYRRLVLADHVAFVRRALEESGESGPVVDVGCGGGLFLRLMKEEGAPVLGIDFSPRAAAVAWQRNGVPAICANFENAPVAPESCAAVTMFHVLEHLPSPDRYVSAAATLLRPEGRLFVQVPNAACWQFLLLGENWSGLDVPRHLVDFRPEDIDFLLGCCGFEIVRHKYFSLRDNPAMLATSLAPSLDPVLRRIRGASESPRMRMYHDLLYYALVMAALPFTLVEAACRAGSTVMVEARKKR